MIPEVGQYVLILALCLAALQFVLPILGIQKHQSNLLQLARPLALGQCFFITLSMLCLAYAFVQDDFSVAYIAQHSNASLPIMYKISALWGGHEGSLLLWVFLLSGWTVAVNFSSRNQSLPFFACVLAVLGAISAGFLLLILFSSNPFSRLLPFYPIDGRDLNPVLQDIGLIIHPPLLYMGYVGFSVPFAFAISALWLADRRESFDSVAKLAVLKQHSLAKYSSGELYPDYLWAKGMRSWVLVAFGFLTLGIMLGSWWAYYELGWGGWWFWDPVENASFLPWLIAIGLIHSLMVTDKRQTFQGWTLMLAILAFAFSIMGTFLVRSGILTSVHAFATDPERGLFLLLFMVLMIGGAFMLYAIRIKKLIRVTKIELYSRETLILVSAVCLLAASFSILLGTLFPLLYDAWTGQKMSVGFPYFNAVFIPLMLPVLIFIPLGPLSQWGDNVIKVLFKKVQWLGMISIILALALPLIITKAQALSFGIVLGLTVGFWIAFGTIKSFVLKIQKKGSIRGLSFGAWGMILAHFGMGVLVIGVTLVSNYSIERTVRISPGQSLELSSYQVNFDSIERIEGSNYIGYRGHFKVLNAGKTIAKLAPEKRIFVVQGSAMSETAIEPGVFRDIYIALGEKLSPTEWSARVYCKPFVRWIWFGAILMALGSLFAAWGRRNVRTKNAS